MAEENSTENAIVAVDPSTGFRVVVGVTCALSVLGSLLIVFSYVWFQSLRTPVRLILVHLSLMDLGVAAANLTGIAINFHHYYMKEPHVYDNDTGLPLMNDVNRTIKIACWLQAGVAIYCTMGSFMWTLAMAIFLYIRIVHYRAPGAAKRLLWACGVWCYLFPVGIVSWKYAMKRVGFSPYSTAGWCGDMLYNYTTGQRNILNTVLGYDLWVYLIFLLVPVLYVATYLHIQQELQRSTRFMSSEKFWALLYSLDYKLLLIPAAFILLRLGSCILAISYVYSNHHLNQSTVSSIVTYFAGIGDSGQGATNALLFVFFTKRVRHKLLPCCCRGPSSERTSHHASSFHATNSFSSKKNYMTISDRSPAMNHAEPTSDSNSD